jgi:hypothetical protein
LSQVEARAEQEGREKPEFDGWAFWAVFRSQFEAVEEHYNCAPLVRDTHLRVTSQDLTSDILRGVPKGATYEETIGALGGTL